MGAELLRRAKSILARLRRDRKADRTEYEKADDSVGKEFVENRATEADGEETLSLLALRAKR